MLELTLFNIIKHFEDNLILDNVGFKIYHKEKVGIVGENGCGKSTILKLIAGIEPLDRDNRDVNNSSNPPGWISMPKGTTVSYLNQIPTYSDDLNVKDVLDLAFEELYDIEKQIRNLEITMENLQNDELQRALKQYNNLQQTFDAKGGYDIEENFSKVCNGLKFDDDFLSKSLSILSGGEKTTVMLGKILLESPDILLLDEPTNHLDMESIEWLEGYIKNYNGIVIIVSHDRYFLDNVVTKIIEVEDKKCETYSGNYSAYTKEKDKRMLLQFAQYKEQQKKIKSMENTIKTLKDWALRSDNSKFFKRAFSMQKKLDKMDKIDKPIFDKQNIKFNIQTTDKSCFDVIKGSNLYKSFDNKVILNNANIHITAGERTALIGPNGCGKSTFLKMLLGESNVDSGALSLGSNLKMAYLPQNITFNNEECRVIDCFREDKSILEGKAREYLAKFMFFGNEPFKKVKNLSGGERVRLKLSMLLYDNINLLLLDEPTNHLDIESMETLESALDDFNGTIFLISHDRYFINRVCNKVIALENSEFINYLGNYDYYRDEKLKSTLPTVNANIIKKEKKKRKPVDEVKVKTINLSKIENEINSLELEISKINSKMAVLESNYEELNSLYNEKEIITKRLDDLLDTWMNCN